MSCRDVKSKQYTIAYKEGEKEGKYFKVYIYLYKILVNSPCG